MGDKTGISWTDSTWNPVRGCSRVSEGCRNCYAESVAYRFSGPGQPYEGLVTIGADGERRRQWNGVVRPVPDHLMDPLKWKRPRRIFVNSMSDLFHEKLRDEEIDKVFAVMALSPQHQFQVLTKRPERMSEYCSSPDTRRRVAVAQFDVSEKTKGGILLAMEHRPDSSDDDPRLWSVWPLPNVWLGTSVENQETADKRIPFLLKTPAAVHFISAEPLLGPVNLARIVLMEKNDGGPDVSFNALKGWHGGANRPGSVHLDWVIVGGESGPSYETRPMHPDWARSLRDQCVSAGVPFFFKQWGEWSPVQAKHYCKLFVDGRFQDSDELGKSGWQDFAFGQMLGTVQGMWCVGKREAGDLLDGKQWQQYPQ